MTSRCSKPCDLAERVRLIVTGSIAGKSGVAPTSAAAADPSSPEKGCHGFHTTNFKVVADDRGAQGSAIGGRGNSDGDPTSGQAHSADGRGAAVQAFLAEFCDVGSLAD
jgi:hypothetical protein